MLHDRVPIVEGNLDRYLTEASPVRQLLGPDEPLVRGSDLTAAAARALFEDQVRSRVLDVVARELKTTGDSYYTISSAGHEDNAVVGTRLRPTDPGFLHYRSGGFMMARARQMGTDPVRDTLLSLTAAADDPSAGGRHKVWGSGAGWVPPQTSTIASHLPKAMGAAFTIGRGPRLGGSVPVPADSIVVCSFGDASANHATALAGINAARYAHRRGNPVPVLFVCEDNGIGISVDTPTRWIADTYGSLPGLAYVRAEGDLHEVWEAVGRAVAHCRTARAPVFLHLETVRLWGHAGSDVERVYRTLEEIERTEARDPILRTARQLVETGAATPDDLLQVVQSTRDRARELGRELAGSRTLATVDEVVGPLAPYDEDTTRGDAQAHVPDANVRDRIFEGSLPEAATTATRRTMASHIGSALRDAMAARPGMMLFGEDVGRKGGVYNVTAGLWQHVGQGRVFDTLLDETSILGLAQGAALMGQLPVPEIQYLAYVHNALDQLRGEACSTSFFSNGQYRNPMVVRIAGLAYQKGFGGHFHNDNSVGALRDIPGLVLAVPSRGDDAARMLRGSLAMAAAHGRVVAFLEPIALYHERDLHEVGDEEWLTTYPSPDEVILPGEVGVHHEDATDVLVLSYANGLRLSLRAARRLAGEGISCRVVDLCWLNPLPTAAIRRHAEACDAVVVVDECRATGGGVADAVVAHLAEAGVHRPFRTVRAHDSFVPLGPAANLVLVSEDDILETVRDLSARRPAPEPTRTQRRQRRSAKG